MATMQMSFFSKKLERLVPVTAIVPIEGKAENGQKPAPLASIYLLHGYSGICTDWVLGSRIHELALKYNVAIFCPSGENSFYLDDEVGGKYYAAYVGEELVNFTRSLFPLSDKQEDTVIAGFSMGGYGALRNGLFFDKTFGAILALSSAMITDRLSQMKPGEIDARGKSAEFYERLFGKLADLPGGDKDINALIDRYVQNNGALPAMYLACGTEDMGIDACRALGKYMSEKPGNTLYEEWPGVHNWAFWDAAIERALEWWSKGRA